MVTEPRSDIAPLMSEMSTIETTLVVGQDDVRRATSRVVPSPWIAVTLPPSWSSVIGTIDVADTSKLLTTLSFLYVQTPLSLIQPFWSRCARKRSAPP